jgi:hypothetical protein
MGELKVYRWRRRRLPAMLGDRPKARKGMKEIDFIQPKKIVGKLISVDVLDKIRAEIMDTGAYEQEVNGKTEFLKGIGYCLDIIDKYKAESEEV